MPSTKLHVNPKDEIVINLRECLDKSRRSTNIEDSSIQKAVNHGKIMALKWVLGYDQLHKVDNEDGITMHTDDEYEPDDDEIDMSKL